MTIEERTEVAKLINESAFDSAAILPAALPALKELGKALSDAKPQGATFLIPATPIPKGSVRFQSLGWRHISASIIAEMK